MLLVWNVTLDKDVIVQVWQSAANAKLTTGQGYQVRSPCDTTNSRLLSDRMISGI